MYKRQVWPVEANLPAPVSAIVNINMLHISPWPCCDALFAGAAEVLVQGAVVVLYGPFKRDGLHRAPSNATFDEPLRSQDPEWGVRALEAVVAVAVEQRVCLSEGHRDAGQQSVGRV